MSTFPRFQQLSTVRAAFRLATFRNTKGRHQNAGNFFGRVFHQPDVEIRSGCPPWRLGFFRGSKFATGYSAVARKSLDSIMKVDSVKHASPEEITCIWNEYHIGRGHVSAVMSSQLFKAFQQRATECPLFVIPLRRGNGFVSILLQAQMPHLLFTSLEDYKARGTQASSYFTVTHYEELADSKGLILVRGDVVFTSKLSDMEAKKLLEIVHSLYLNDSRFKLVKQFNKHSEDFNFQDVLIELGSTA